MLFEKVHILNEKFEIEKNMYLGIEGDRITYLSKAAPSGADRDNLGPVYSNCQGKLVAPGFFNCHTHVPMALLRGYGENLSLDRWLNTRIFPFEAKLTPADVYWSSLAGIAEALRFGIVCNADMYMHTPAMCKAYFESGMKANLNDAVVSFEDADLKSMAFYQTTLDLMEEYNSSQNGIVKVEFGLHAEYTSTESTVRQLAEIAKEHNSSIHVHVSETSKEVLECRERRNGRSPVEYLNDCGLFDVPAIAAHCVHIDEKDVSIFKEKSVSVATCPVSNLKLASGVMPAKLLIDNNVNVTIGTDSVASNNNLNFLEDIKTYSLIQKGISLDPTLITPSQALKSATSSGAIAMGRADSGSIKIGNKADLILINIDGPHFSPSDHLLNHLVYSSCGGDVYMTMVDGKILYENGEYKTLDIEKVLFQVEKSYKRIVSSL